MCKVLCSISCFIPHKGGNLSPSVQLVKCRDPGAGDTEPGPRGGGRGREAASALRTDSLVEVMTQNKHDTIRSEESWELKHLVPGTQYKLDVCQWTRGGRPPPKDQERLFKLSALSFLLEEFQLTATWEGISSKRQK